MQSFSNSMPLAFAHKYAMPSMWISAGITCPNAWRIPKSTELQLLIYPLYSIRHNGDYLDMV